MFSCGSDKPAPLAVLLVLWGVAAIAAAPLRAQVDLRGYVSFESRYFLESPAQSLQLDGAQLSLAVEPEIFFETKSGTRSKPTCDKTTCGETEGKKDYRHQFSLVPFLRLDDEDDERTHFDLREAYWRLVGDSWDLTVGINSVFWGVTESRHLVNIINQIDAVEDVDEEDFLGQPMVALGLRFPWGRVELFALPGFRERTFPGEAGRLRGGLVVDTDRALFESSRADDAIDWALRYAHFIGDWDIGAQYFYGTSREPRLVVASDSAGNRLLPLYDRVHQVGIDIQWTQGAWLYKLEAIRRFTELDDFGAWVAGFEYTLFQAWGSTDLGLLAEVLHDGRDLELAPPTTSDADLFIGARLSLNDLAETSLLAGGVIDHELGSASLRLEGERRLRDAWTLELSGQFFVNVDAEDPVAAIEQDSFVQLRLNWSF